MRCHLIYCKDSSVIKEVIVDNFSELPAICREEEIRLNGNGDGYAVYATYNSDIVADAEGLCSHWRPDPVYQAGLMYACGYHD